MTSLLEPLILSLAGGAVAVSMVACSKELPTAPASKGGELASSSRTRAANDDFLDALAIGSLPFTHTVNTANATTQHDDPLNDESCGFGSIGGHTVWYQFTAAENVRVNASTAGSNFDPNIFAYTGDQADLTRVACNFLPASMTFEAVAGQRYFILVGSPDGAAGGSLVLSVDRSVEVGVTIDPTAAVNPSTGVATISGTVTCSRSAFFELGGSVAQRKVFASQGSLFASGDCNGVTRWQGEVAGENGRFVPGKAQVSAGALFTVTGTTEERRGGPTTATVTLR